MTEEIIINGVNVAGCEFFDNYECNIYVNEYWEPQDNTKDMCKWHENCYYKQLKRLEQENKELKETIKQYCEWLDEERESNDKLQKVYQDDHCDLLNYRTALEEIRELTVIGVNASQCNCGLRALANDILDKINEVLQ